MMTPFVVGRESSVRALEEALTGDRRIFLATQHDASIDEPTADDIYTVGVIGNIVQSVRMPDGNIKVLVEGVERARASEINDDDGFFVATVKTSHAQLEPNSPQRSSSSLARVHQLFEQYAKLQQSLNSESVTALRTDEPAKLADLIARSLQLSIEEKQQLLEVFDPEIRLTRIADALDIAIEKLTLDRTVQSREAPDGTRAKRVLPQRKDQGDPEGTR